MTDAEQPQQPYIKFLCGVCEGKGVWDKLTGRLILIPLVLTGGTVKPQTCMYCNGQGWLDRPVFGREGAQ